MKKTTKALALVLCAMLLVVGSVMGTLAYLKDDATVTNTFTVGNVTITMDEAKVDEYGEKLYKADGEGNPTNELAERVGANVYKLIPGHKYVKDPTIWVGEGSEACWLFVELANGIADIEVERTDEDNIITQMLANGWTAFEGTTNVYYKENATHTADGYVLFERFKIKDDANVANYASATNEAAKISIKAYAVQADGLATVAEAWAAASDVANN